MNNLVGRDRELQSKPTLAENKTKQNKSRETKSRQGEKEKERERERERESEGRSEGIRVMGWLQLVQCLKT